MGVVRGGPQLVEKNPQPLGVILHLEGEVEKGTQEAWHARKAYLGKETNADRR